MSTWGLREETEGKTVRRTIARRPAVSAVLLAAQIRQGRWPALPVEDARTSTPNQTESISAATLPRCRDSALAERTEAGLNS